MPTARRWLLPVLVATPAVAVALAGLAHPVLLTPSTAARWRAVHLVLLPLFPLVGGSVWLLLLGRRGALAWAARGLAAAFGLLYTALDSIAGIGAGQQVVSARARGSARPPVEDLFSIGDALGHPGVYALAAALALTAVLLGGRAAVAGGLLSVASCWLLLRHHVFPPLGVLGVLGIAAGLVLLAVAAQPEAAVTRSDQRRPVGIGP